MGNTLTNNDNNNAIASSRCFTKCIYRSPRRTFVLMWVFLIGMSIISLLTCKFEIDIGVDSFQVQSTHPSVVSLDSLEAAKAEWKKIKEESNKLDEETEKKKKKDEKKDNTRLLLLSKSSQQVESPKLSPRALEKKKKLRLLSRLEVVFMPSEKVPVDKITGIRNVLKKEIFEQIHKVELLAQSLQGYKSFCLPTYDQVEITGCVPPNSLMTYFYPSRDEKGNYKLDGKGDKMLYFDFTLAEVLNQERTYFYFSDDVDPQTKSASFIKTVFIFASQHGNDIGNFEKDKKEFEIFVNQYIDIFRKINTNPEFDLIHLVFGGQVITQSEIMMTLFDDLKYAIVSFLVVYLFTLRHIKSVFLSTFGLLQIVSTFPISLLFFKFVGVGIGSSPDGVIKLGVLHALSIYIMLGIGVDDIYVLIDAFRQQNPNDTLDKRMEKAWKRAAGAMLITSFTTAAAFASNFVTIIPVIQGFVVFMSILVIFNYLLVISIFPITIIYYKMHIENYEKEIYGRMVNKCCKKKQSNSSNVSRLFRGNRNRSRSRSLRRRHSSSDWDGVQLQSLTSSLTTEANDKNNNDDGGGGGDTMNFSSSINISNEEYPNDESNTILDLEDVSLLDSGNENADSPYQQANDDAAIALEQTLPPEVRCLVCCTKFVTRSRRRSITLIVLFMCISLIGLIFATQLQTAKDIPKLFPDSNNIQSYLQSTQEMFNHQTHCDDCSGFYQSEELCKNVDCNDRGSCILGVCKCDQGWRGDDCTIAANCASLRCDKKENEECINGNTCACKNGYTRNQMTKKCEVPKRTPTTTTPPVLTTTIVTTSPSPMNPTTQVPVPVNPTTQGPNPVTSSPLPVNPVTTQGPSPVNPVTTPSPVNPVTPGPTPVNPVTPGPSPVNPVTPGPSPVNPVTTHVPVISTTQGPLPVNPTTTIKPPTTATAVVTTTTKKPSYCTNADCGQYGKCNPAIGCQCDDLYEGANCEKCLVPGHYFPRCNETAEAIEKPVNNNRAKVTYVWGISGNQQGSTTDFDEKSIRAIYYKSFDISNPDAQLIVVSLCDKLRARPDLVQPRSEFCIMVSFKKWLEEDKGANFPVKTKSKFLSYFIEFLHSKAGTKFNNAVGFDNPKIPTKVKFISISYFTLLRPYESGFASLGTYQEFKNILEDVNSNANTELGKALLVSELWPRMFTEVIAVVGTLFGIGLTTIIALLSIWMFTGTLRGACLAIGSLLGVLCVVLGGFFLLDWKLGIVEAISIGILLGSAIDYPAHVLEAFVSTRPSPEEDPNLNVRDTLYQRRVNRITHAIQHIGPSIINASGTTICSVFALLFCTIEVFTKVGEILVLSCSISILYSLVPLVAVLSVIGPEFRERTFTSIVNTVSIVCMLIGFLILVYVIVKAFILPNNSIFDLLS